MKNDQSKDRLKRLAQAQQSIDQAQQRFAQMHLAQASLQKSRKRAEMEAADEARLSESSVASAARIQKGAMTRTISDKTDEYLIRKEPVFNRNRLDRLEEKKVCYISRNGQVYGPFSWTDMQSFPANGQLLPTDMVMLAERQGWVQAHSVKGLFNQVKERLADQVSDKN